MAILVVLIILLVLLTFLGAFGGSIRYKESYNDGNMHTSSEYPVVHPSQMHQVQSYESHPNVEMPAQMQHPGAMVNHQVPEHYEEEMHEGYGNDEVQEDYGEEPIEPFDDKQMGAPY
jgi:hypothetical protein